MSWSLSYASKDDLTNDKPSYRPTEDATPDQLEQIEVAREIAWRIISSGACGDGAVVDFGITLSGHSNPGHVPNARYANDCISVSIYQKSPPQAS